MALPGFSGMINFPQKTRANRGVGEWILVPGLEGMENAKQGLWTSGENAYHRRRYGCPST